MVLDKWYLIKSISAVTNYNSSSCFKIGNVGLSEVSKVNLEINIIEAKVEKFQRT